MVEQTLYWYKVKNVNLTSCSCERPAYLKNYAHFDLTTSDDKKFTIVISPRHIQEAEQITEAEAEVLHRKWEDAKEYIEPLSGKKVKTERSLGEMYKSFKHKPFDEVVKFVRGK